MSVVVPQSTPVSPAPRYAFLDGLRGLAALYVMFYHFFGWNLEGYSHYLVQLTRPFQFGHFSVSLFIVLSGYSLMLPVVRSADRQLRGGATQYFFRRAKRILPPYYAALVLSCVVLYFAVSATPPDLHASLSLHDFVSHALLLHNLGSSTNNSINMALWSVATEWQIYFLFPFIFLPLWRRLGLPGVILCGIILSLVPALVLPDAHNLAWACPWYIALFTFGMAAATAPHTGQERSVKIILIAALAAPLYFVVKFAFGTALTSHTYYIAAIKDGLAGVLAACFVIWCARSVARSQRSNPIIRFLSCRPAVLLGHMSYSLYLIHCAMLSLFIILLTHFRAGILLAFSLKLLAGIPITLLVAYLFHLVAEKPFMSITKPQPVIGDNASPSGHPTTIAANP